MFLPCRIALAVPLAFAKTTYLQKQNYKQVCHRLVEDVNAELGLRINGYGSNHVELNALDAFIVKKPLSIAADNVC